MPVAPLSAIDSLPSNEELMKLRFMVAAIVVPFIFLLLVAAAYS